MSTNSADEWFDGLEATIQANIREYPALGHSVSPEVDSRSTTEHDTNSGHEITSNGNTNAFQQSQLETMFHYESSLDESDQSSEHSDYKTNASTPKASEHDDAASTSYSIPHIEVTSPTTRTTSPDPPTGQTYILILSINNHEFLRGEETFYQELSRRGIRLKVITETINASLNLECYEIPIYAIFIRSARWLVEPSSATRSIAASILRHTQLGTITVCLTSFARDIIDGIPAYQLYWFFSRFNVSWTPQLGHRFSFDLNPQRGLKLACPLSDEFDVAAICLDKVAWYDSVYIPRVRTEQIGQLAAVATRVVYHGFLVYIGDVNFENVTREILFRIVMGQELVPGVRTYWTPGERRALGLCDDEEQKR